MGGAATTEHRDVLGQVRSRTSDTNWISSVLDTGIYLNPHEGVVDGYVLEDPLRVFGAPQPPKYQFTQYSKQTPSPPPPPLESPYTHSRPRTQGRTARRGALVPEKRRDGLSDVAAAALARLRVRSGPEPDLPATRAWTVPVPPRSLSPPPGSTAENDGSYCDAEDHRRETRP